MRVLLVIRAVGKEGAGKMAFSVINSLVEKHEMAILNYNQESIIDGLDDKVKKFYGRKSKRYAEYIYAIKRIAFVIKDFKPDIVLAFRSNAAGLTICSRILYKLDVPIVVSERTDPYKENNLLLYLCRKLFRYASGGVFQTQQAYEYYKKIVKNYRIIPNPAMPLGISCEKKFIERNDEIVNVARLHIQQKRQDVLLKAFKIVHDKYPALKLSLIGGGYDKNELENLAKQLNIESKVYFYGKISNVPELLAKSKMFVLSSDYEGISNALIEAMSIGLPCISTDTSPGGARVLIDNGKNGFIVPCGDEKALAERIIYYYEHPNIADSHGKKAQRITERFSPNVIFKMWEDFLFETIKTYHKNDITCIS